MAESLQYLIDSLSVSPKSERRQLHLSHPDAKVLKEKDIVMAALCVLREKCEISRNDPGDHALIFSLEGEATLYISDSPRKRIPIKPGHLVILPAHNRHKYVMEGKEWKVILFYLADTYSWRLIRDSKPHVRLALAQNELKAALEGFLSETLRNEKRSSQAIQHYSELILLNLDRELDMEESNSSQEMKHHLYQLWGSVSADLAHNWTVSEMAGKIGISSQHFYKVSARYCGYKPVEMVARLRMQQAQEYLIGTDYMVKSIARLVGYSDSFGFSAAFKRHTGCSPKQFREKYHQQCAQKHKQENEDGWY